MKIPAGVKEGQTIRVKGRGGAGRAGGANGDILIQIGVAPHPYMTRDGNDVRMDLPVTLKEAVVGGKVPVPALGGTLSVTVPPGSNTGTVLRLKGKGIAAKDGAGDLYVRLVVTLPDTPDSALKDFAADWASNYDPRARIVKESADEVLAALGVSDPLLDIAKELEQVALADDYFKERKLYPNVDFYTGVIYKAMGFPTRMFTVLFALGRLPGWIAHWREMHSEPGKIGRPRQIYTGYTERDYVDLSGR